MVPGGATISISYSPGVVNTWVSAAAGSIATPNIARPPARASNAPTAIGRFIGATPSRPGEPASAGL